MLRYMSLGVSKGHVLKPKSYLTYLPVAFDSFLNILLLDDITTIVVLLR